MRFTRKTRLHARPWRSAPGGRAWVLAALILILSLPAVTALAAGGASKAPIAAEVFDALVGEALKLTAADGTVTEGKLKAVAGQKLILILADGSVVVLPKASIVDVNVGAQAPAPAPTVAAPKLPPECAQLPGLLAKVGDADSKVALASEACGVVGDAVGSAIADQLGGLLGLGGLGQSLADAAAQGAVSAGCETVAESAIYDDLRERYNELVALCEGSGATAYVSSNASVHAAAAKRPKKSDYLKAVEAGDVETAKGLLDAAKGDDQMFQESGGTWRCDIWYAVRNRDLPMVKLLTESHAYTPGNTCLPDFRSSGYSMRSELVHTMAATNGDVEILDLLMKEGPPYQAWSTDGSGLSTIDHVAKIEGPKAREIQAEMESYARREENSFLIPMVGWNTRSGFPLYGVRFFEVQQAESPNGLSALGFWYGATDDPSARMKMAVGGSYVAWERRLYSSADGKGQVILSLSLGLEYRESYLPVSAGDTGSSFVGDDGDLVYAGELHMVEEFSVLPVSLTYALHTNGSGGVDIGIQTFVMEINEKAPEFGFSTFSAGGQGTNPTLRSSGLDVSFFSLENVNLFARFRLF